MADWVETELKLGLPGEAAWKWVREKLGPGRVSMQTNHFFDDPDQSLRQQRIGVRLRAERDESGETSHTLTVKGKLGDAPPGPFTRRLELESPLGPDSFAHALHSGIGMREPIRAWRKIAPADDVEREALAELLDALETSIRRAHLECYASFRNRRETLMFAAQDEEGNLDIELELDRTEFPGPRVDFEIEVERTSERDGSMKRTHRALCLWLEQEGEFRTFAAEGKLSRMHAILARTPGAAR